MDSFKRSSSSLPSQFEDIHLASLDLDQACFQPLNYHHCQFQFSIQNFFPSKAFYNIWLQTFCYLECAQKVLRWVSVCWFYKMFTTDTCMRIYTQILFSNSVDSLLSFSRK